MKIQVWFKIILGSSTIGSNILRQIISVKNGLNKVNTKYTLKIRSDCYFASNKILKLDLEKYKYDNKFKIFKEKLLHLQLAH